MTSETITAAGETLQTVWLRASVKASKKPGLFIVQLDVPELIERPTFYVEKSDIRLEGHAEPGTWVDGQVRVLLMGEDGDTLVVQVPGDAVSYGPRLVVPQALAA